MNVAVARGRRLLGAAPISANISANISASISGDLVQVTIGTADEKLTANKDVEQRIICMSGVHERDHHLVSQINTCARRSDLGGYLGADSRRRLRGGLAGLTPNSARADCPAALACSSSAPPSARATSCNARSRGRSDATPYTVCAPIRPSSAPPSRSHRVLPTTSMTFRRFDQVIRSSVSVSASSPRSVTARRRSWWRPTWPRVVWTSRT